MELVWRPFLAGLGMGFVCWLVKEMELASVVMGISSGFAVYAALLLILQTFTRQELALLRDAMRVRLGSAT